MRRGIAEQQRHVVRADTRRIDVDADRHAARAPAACRAARDRDRAARADVVGAAAAAALEDQRGRRAPCRGRRSGRGARRGCRPRSPAPSGRPRCRRCAGRSPTRRTTDPAAARMVERPRDRHLARRPRCARPSISCASLLSAVRTRRRRADASSSSGLVGRSRRPAPSSGSATRASPPALAQRLEQMVGAAHVDRERRLGRVPRSPDVRRAGAVIDGRRAEAARSPRDAPARSSRSTASHVTSGGPSARRACRPAGASDDVGRRPVAASRSSRWLPANPAAPVTSDRATASARQRLSAERRPSRR